MTVAQQAFPNSFAAGSNDAVLLNTITSGATTLDVVALPAGVSVAPFDIKIGTEWIHVGAIGGSGNKTWSSLTRGYGGSAPASHTAGALIYLEWLGESAIAVLTGRTHKPDQLILTEESPPATPAANEHNLFVHSATHRLSRVQSDGTVIDLERQYDVHVYGAKGDGVTDDTTPWLNAIAAAKNAGGGVVTGQPGRSYCIKRTLEISGSNIRVNLNGAEILFQPIDPVTYDRAISIHAGDSGGYSALRPITGAIALGATTFTAANLGDVADLVAGDWLMVEESDSILTTIVYFDWMQVASVAGAVVTLYNPFRTAFPGTHGTVYFSRIVNLVQNVNLSDVTIRTTTTTHSLVGVGIGVARDVTLDRVTSNPAKGNAFFSYRTAALALSFCNASKDLTQATEFAATAGLTLIGNKFHTVGAAPTTAALGIDFGTCFFALIANEIAAASGIGLELVHGCHDGVVIGNSISMIAAGGSAISSLGSQRVYVAGNPVVGTGAAATGIGFADDTGTSPTIASVGNMVGPNPSTGFTIPYSVTATDFITDPLQPLSLYNVLTAGGDYERAILEWVGNSFKMLTQQGGTGAARHMYLGTSGVAYLIFLTDSIERWYLDQSAGHLYPWIDATYDIGLAATQRIRNLYVSSSVVMKTKAGGPSDSDVVNPVDGMQVLDTTNNRVYYRTGGAWKYAALT